MPAPVGILPFETTDPSVILRTSLTSAASVSAPAVGPAGTITGTGHTFSELGFQPAAAGNSGIAFASPTNFALLDNAGQCSFEITRDMLTFPSTTYQSSGFAPAGIEWWLAWGNGTNHGRIRKIVASNSVGLRFHDAGDTLSNLNVHSELKPDPLRLTISWVGASFAMYVNGAPVQSWVVAPTKNARWSNQWQNISVMCFGAGINPPRSGAMRNLIVSSEPVVLPRHPRRRVAFLGHPFSVTFSDTAFNYGNFEATVSSELRRLAMARGYDYETAAFGVGGGFWDPALSALDIRDFIAPALATLPHVIVCYGPTNDVGNAGFNAATVDTEIKAALTTIAGNIAINAIERLVFCTTPSRAGVSAGWSDATRANIVESNANIRALPAWWNATFPSQAGKLVIADLFDAWSGMLPGQAVMIGQRSGALDDLHPSVLGLRSIAQAIFSVI